MLLVTSMRSVRRVWGFETVLAWTTCVLQGTPLLLLAGEHEVCEDIDGKSGLPGRFGVTWTELSWR